MNMGRIVLPGDTEVVVVSYGGVGTTFLLRFLAQYMKTNDPDDSDGFKHSTLPLVSFNPKVKFIYVYGNPQLAATSLFRRSYHHDQSIKLQKWSSHTTSPIPKEMTLQEYASEGIDKFNFSNNFYNWYDKYLSSYPTMFVRYESIFDNIEAILDFLDLPKECIENFPKSKNRSSSIQDIPVETLGQLDNMYGDFSDQLEKLDDVEIRVNENQKTSKIRYLTPPYIRAFVDQLIYELKERLKKYAPKIYTMLKVIINKRGSGSKV